MKARTLFIVLGVLVLFGVGLGFARGWFGLSTNRSSTGGNQFGVNLMVDPDKAKQDANMVGAKASSLTGNAPEGTPNSAPDGSAKSKDK